MKKIVITVILLSVIFGIQFVDLVNANPTPLFPFPLEQPIRDLPKVIIHSPIQNTIYNTSTILLNFSIIKPDGWFQSEEYRNQGYGGQFGNITSIYYVIDNKKQEISIHDVDSLCKGYPNKVLNFSVPLNLMNGNHSLKVGCDADSYYVHIIIGQEFELHSVSIYSESSPVNFENVNQSIPIILILSPQNTTYAAIGNNYVNVPLTFVANASLSLSWFGYSLDGKENVTAINGTSIKLPVASKNLTLYANDTAGNWAAPQTVYYSVAWNGGTPPPPTPFPWLPVTASIGIIAVVTASLLIYFKKLKFNKTS